MLTFFIEVRRSTYKSIRFFVRTPISPQIVVAGESCMVLYESVHKNGAVINRNNSWNADTYETILAFFTHFFDAPFIVFIDQSIDTSQPKLWNVRFSSTVQFPSTRSVFKYCCLQSAQPFLVVLIAVSTHVFKVQLSASYNPVTLKLLRIVQPVSERDFRTIYGKHSSSIYQVNNLL